MPSSSDSSSPPRRARRRGRRRRSPSSHSSDFRRSHRPSRRRHLLTSWVCLPVPVVWDRTPEPGPAFRSFICDMLAAGNCMIGWPPRVNGMCRSRFQLYSILASPATFLCCHAMTRTGFGGTHPLRSLARGVFGDIGQPPTTSASPTGPAASDTPLARPLWCPPRRRLLRLVLIAEVQNSGGTLSVPATSLATGNSSAPVAGTNGCQSCFL